MDTAGVVCYVKTRCIEQMVMGFLGLYSFPASALVALTCVDLTVYIHTLEKTM